MINMYFTYVEESFGKQVVGFYQIGLIGAAGQPPANLIIVPV